jgi:hypothetical protein
MSILGIILSIFLWLLAIVAGLLLVLFVVPFSAGLRGWVNGLSGEGQLEVRWGFGFLSVQAALPGGFALRLLGLPIVRRTFAQMAPKPKSEEERAREAQKKADKKAVQKVQKKGKKKARKQAGKGFKLAYARPLLALAVRVLKSVRLRGWVAGMVGVGDPAETAAIAALLNQLNRADGRFTMDVTPDWIDEMLDIQGDVRLCFWLPRTVFVVMLIIVDRKARRLLRAMA